jgi:hypothetical protein
MSSVKILFPKPGFVIPPGGILAATGRAAENVVYVEGTLTPKGGGGHPIKALRLSFDRKTDKSGKASYCWCLGFVFTPTELDPSGGEVELKVVGHDERGPVGTATIDLRTPAQPGHIQEEIHIGYPQSGDHTEELCQGLTGYGPLSNADLAVDSCGIFDSSNNLVAGPETLGSTSPPMWVVTFFPINGQTTGSATYTLQVEDTGGNQDDVPDLVQNFPCS